MFTPTSPANTDLRFKSPGSRTSADDAEIMRQRLGISPQNWQASDPANTTEGIDRETLKLALRLPGDATDQDMNEALRKVQAIRTGKSVDDVPAAGMILDGGLLRQAIGMPDTSVDQVNAVFAALADPAHPAT